MKAIPLNPLLYQINTQVLLRSSGIECIGDIPDSYLDEIAKLGFNYVYLLGIWEYSKGALKHSVKKFEHNREISPDSIEASPFAIAQYSPRNEYVGGLKGIVQFRERLHKRGIRLLVDFVPNHLALDHVWLDSHPQWLIQGNQELLEKEPENYFKHGNTVFAHGRDPHFPGWGDTVQLNYASDGLRTKLKEILVDISTNIADAVRCDMAMLVNNDIFLETWGNVLLLDVNGNKTRDILEQLGEFWVSTIRTVLTSNPDFRFIAEVYWDKEFDLQSKGFHFCYDKKLYDNLKTSINAQPVASHLYDGEYGYQQKLVRFLENHDEPRASDTFGPISEGHSKHKAAAIISLTSPGLRFIHEGQLHGRKKFVSMHLGIRPMEMVDTHALTFYCRLLQAISDSTEFMHGFSGKCVVTPSKDNNLSFCNIFASFHFVRIEEQHLLDNSACKHLAFHGNSKGYNTLTIVVANYSNFVSNGHIQLDLNVLPTRLRDVIRQIDAVAILEDILSGISFVRKAKTLIDESEKLWFDLQPWQSHIFRVRVVPEVST